MKTELRFTKMQGIGNDYIYVNGFAERVSNPPAVSRFVSNRNFGIGSDGLVLILPSDKGSAADGYFLMRMFNADGSEAEMCGNAIRCVAKYVYEKDLCKKTLINIDTLSGNKLLLLNVEGEEVTSVRVDMGTPSFESRKIPVEAETPEVIDQPIEVMGEQFRFTAVSVGNPHAVIAVPRVLDRHILTLGPLIENHRMFPKKINVEFAEIVSPTHLKMRVWERGSGETLACGTGACAVAVALAKLGKSSRHVQVELRGGNLEIMWADAELAKKHDLVENHMYMTGPAEIVFEGTVRLPETLK